MQFIRTEEEKLLSQNEKIILCGICTLRYYKSKAIMEDNTEHVSTE